MEPVPGHPRHAGVVVPIRAFRSGKARLADALDADQRAELALAMAERVVAAAGPLPIVVVSSDAGGAGLGRRHRDRGRGGPRRTVSTRPLAPASTGNGPTDVVASSSVTRTFHALDPPRSSASRTSCQGSWPSSPATATTARRCSRCPPAWSSRSPTDRVRRDATPRLRAASVSPRPSFATRSSATTSTCRPISWRSIASRCRELRRSRRGRPEPVGTAAPGARDRCAPR